MKIVIFGPAMSSPWGRGHAGLWRGLCRGLAELGHTAVVFDRCAPNEANPLVFSDIPEDGELIRFSRWEDAVLLAREHLDEADVGMVTSSCCDEISASELVLASSATTKIFYDLERPTEWPESDNQPWTDCPIPRKLGGFDLVLSITGGSAMKTLRERFGARLVAPLYSGVDPSVYHPTAKVQSFNARLSYLGAYTVDRRKTLDSLFVEPARALPKHRFLIAGSQYPPSLLWGKNISFVRPIELAKQPAFLSSAQATLIATRDSLKKVGFCPSDRLFEAAACGVPILTDEWEGLDHFFQPDLEIKIARTSDDAIAFLKSDPDELQEIAVRARERVLTQHTCRHRAEELIQLLRPSAKHGWHDSRQLPKELALTTKFPR